MVGELRMKLKENKTKWDLIWIIPEIIGSIAISLSGALHIKHIAPHTTIGLMEWIFQIGIVLVVIGVGFKGFGVGMDELKDLLHKRTQR